MKGGQLEEADLYYKRKAMPLADLLKFAEWHSDERVQELGERLEEIEAAVRQMVSAHMPSPQFPNGHIYAADCDACHYRQIGERVLEVVAPPVNRDSAQ